MPAKKPAKLAKHLTAKDLEKFKQALLERRAQLVGDEKSVHASTLHADDISDDFADQSSEAYELDFAFSRMESVELEIKEIDGALERIELGTYGVCEETGTPIPKKRLIARPFSRLCLEAKEKLEAEQGGFV